jgi:hypothetical protein
MSEKQDVKYWAKRTKNTIDCVGKE